MATYLNSIMPVLFLFVDDINSDSHLAFQVDSTLIVGIDSDRVDTHFLGAVLEFVHQGYNVCIAAQSAQLRLLFGDIVIRLRVFLLGCRASRRKCQ